MTDFNSWNDSQPIYLQLREKIIALIIDGVLAEGEAVPSVRQVSSQYRINHLTVAKAYQELVDDGLLEKRRGVGMFVLAGARQQLFEREKHKFIETEVPKLAERMTQLDISVDELITHIKNNKREN